MQVCLIRVEQLQFFCRCANVIIGNLTLFQRWCRWYFFNKLVCAWFRVITQGRLITFPTVCPQPPYSFMRSWSDTHPFTFRYLHSLADRWNSNTDSCNRLATPQYTVFHCYRRACVEFTNGRCEDWGYFQIGVDRTFVLLICIFCNWSCDQAQF